MATQDSIIDKIEEIRRSNNRLWMDILRTALKSAPEATRTILDGINKNDREISKLLGELSSVAN
jgi:hypothetical protein